MESNNKIEQFDKEAVVDAAVKKRTIQELIKTYKSFNPWYKRTHPLIRAAEAVLKKVKGENLNQEEQFKLFNCFYAQKEKALIGVRPLYQDIISALSGKTPALPPECLREFSDAEAINNASDLKKLLRANPFIINHGVDLLKSYRIPREEILRWIAQHEDPVLVADAIYVMIKTGTVSMVSTTSYIKLLTKLNIDQFRGVFL